MPLGKEVGLGPGGIVLNEDTASLPKRGGAASPNFQSMSIVAKWMDASRCHFVRRPRPSDIVLDENPAPSPKRGWAAAPNFRPIYCSQTAGWINMPLGTCLWPRSPISATAELFLTDIVTWTNIYVFKFLTSF